MVWCWLQRWALVTLLGFIGTGSLLLGPALPAHAETIQGFDLTSTDDDLKVTLHTDKPVQVEKQANVDGGITLLIPKAKLSSQLIRKGLPVVLDNNNRFMGRAVPAGESGVKIVLPNVPGSQINVSIEQQRGTPEPSAEAAMKPVRSKPGRQAKPQATASQQKTAQVSPQPAAEEPLAPVTLAQALDPNADAPSAEEAAEQWTPLINSLKGPSKVAAAPKKRPATPRQAPTATANKIVEELKATQELVTNTRLASGPADLIVSAQAPVDENDLQGLPVAWQPVGLTPVAAPFLSSSAVRNADWLAPLAIQTIQASAPPEAVAVMAQASPSGEAGVAVTSKESEVFSLPAWSWIVLTVLALAAASLAWRALQNRYQPAALESNEVVEGSPRPIMRRQRPNTYAPMTLQSQYGQLKAPFTIPKTPSLGPRKPSIYQHSETLLAGAAKPPAMYQRSYRPPVAK